MLLKLNLLVRKNFLCQCISYNSGKKLKIKRATRLKRVTLRRDLTSATKSNLVRQTYFFSVKVSAHEVQLQNSQ